MQSCISNNPECTREGSKFCLKILINSVKCWPTPNLLSTKKFSSAQRHLTVQKVSVNTKDEADANLNFSNPTKSGTFCMYALMLLCDPTQFSHEQKIP